MKEFGWRKMHLERLRYLYGEEYRRWAGKHEDDRAVYCKMYEQIEGALRSLPAEPNLYVKNAVGAKIKADRETLDRIKAVFKKRERSHKEATREAARA